MSTVKRVRRAPAQTGIAFVAALALFSSMSGCSSDPPPACALEGPRPDLNLTLVDPSGAPICGAFVTLTSAAQSQTYQPSGRDSLCNLYSARIPPDTYTLSISAKGFAPLTESLTIGYSDVRCAVPQPATQTITMMTKAP